MSKTAFLAEQWRQTCAALALGGGEGQYRKLLRVWSGWGRHYHSVEHLIACLQEFDRVRHLAAQQGEVEMALWFHDAVYRTYRKDNEDRSAAWAARFLASRGAAPDVVLRVRDLVLATKHSGGELAGDAALVVDVDLSILGQSPETYAEFERNIRREYWWVPRRSYASARGRILEAFLAQPAIYHWPHFQERYESTARANIARAITALGFVSRS